MFSSRMFATKETRADEHAAITRMHVSKLAATNAVASGGAALHDRGVVRHAPGNSRIRMTE